MEEQTTLSKAHILTIIKRNEGVLKERFDFTNYEKDSEFIIAIVNIVKFNPMLFHFLMSLYAYYSDIPMWNTKTAKITVEIAKKLK
jgi:hypothetical protein